MFKKKTFIPTVIVFVLLVISYSVLFIFEGEKLVFWLDEDGFFETGGALMFLLASFMLIYLFFKSKSGNNFVLYRTERNLFFLLLGLLFFFIFGEEISWGQRIFNIDTPEIIAEINVQKEINLHNLSFFHGDDSSGARKKGIEVWHNMDRLFSVFWLLYCFVTPLLNSYSKKISKFLGTLNLPIVPLWVGNLFVINYILSKALEKMFVFSEMQRVVEIKEANLGFLFFIVALSFYFKFAKDTAPSV